MNYKTFMVSLAVLGLLVLPVLPTKAMTATEVQAQIDSVTQQIAVLQAQLASLQAWCHNFNAQYGCQANTQPSLTLTSPKGGETWVKGGKRTITWKASNFSGDVAIDLITGSGQYRIATAPGGVGSYSWKVGSTISGIAMPQGSKYKIEIYDSNNPSNLQSFSNYFSIIVSQQLSIATSRFIF